MQDQSRALLPSHRETESKSGSGKKNNDAAEDMRTAGMARGDSPRRTAGPRGGRKRRRRRGRGEAKLGFGPAQGSVGYKGGLWSEGFLPGRWILRVTNVSVKPWPSDATGVSNLASPCGRSGPQRALQ